MSRFNSGYFSTVKKFEKIATGEVKNFTRKVAQMAYRGVVDRTPIDTGRARASWSLDEGDNATKTTATLSIDIPRIQSFRASNEAQAASIGAGYKYIISNNLFYIKKLDSGSGSTQAPFGMVSITVEEIGALVRSNVL